MVLTIVLELLRFFHQCVFFVTGVASEIECIGTTESPNILYVSVKINLYEQTEY